jgi:RNA polymerase sigma factor (sigma-70 family)
MPSATGNINDDLEEFVGAIRANEEKVLKQFYQQNYPMVEKFVLDNSGTIDEARDIYQEAFIAVWRNIQLGRFQLRADSSPQAYLFKVAKYKWLDHLRATKRKNLVPLSGDEEIEELPAEKHGRIEAIKSSFSQLGESCRELLERFYYLKQSMRTIAAAKKWTEATAKNNKYRCLQHLRDILKNKKPNH